MELQAAFFNLNLLINVHYIIIYGYEYLYLRFVSLSGSSWSGGESEGLDWVLHQRPGCWGAAASSEVLRCDRGSVWPAAKQLQGDKVLMDCMQ